MSMEKHNKEAGSTEKIINHCLLIYSSNYQQHSLTPQYTELQMNHISNWVHNAHEK